MLFRDRIDAAKRLAAVLHAWRGENAVVMGVPRGGVVIADVVARELGLPFGCLMARKVVAPGSSRTVIGAVTLDGHVRLDTHAVNGLETSAVDKAVQQAGAELAIWQASFHAPAARDLVADRVVLIVDDGILTGRTLDAAIDYAARLGAARLVLAAPCGVRESVARLAPRVDSLVVLVQSGTAEAVAGCYEHLDAVTDEDIAARLGRKLRRH